MNKIAVYSGTRNLYPHILTCIKSLLIHSDVEKIYLLIEDDEFPEKLPGICECINVSNQTYFRKDGVNMHRYFTYMAYMRAALPKIFPDLDKILSLDADAIVVDDINDIWDLPIDDCYYSAAYEMAKSRSDFFYANTGVCLYNLKKIREDGIDDKVIEAVNEKEYICPEQDALAELCQGHIYEMPQEYNATRYTKPTDHPKIVHYAGITNWVDYAEYKEFERIDISEIPKIKKRLKDIEGLPKIRYMIHTTPMRKWYVDEYLKPSMWAQGIPKESIMVWNDDCKMGNLKSFVESMRYVADNFSFLEGVWHLQDDVVLSKHFSEYTEGCDNRIICGFSNEKWDGGNVNLIGVVPAHFAWLSFQCIRIPNYYAREFIDWFEDYIVKKGESKELVASGKNDDSVWKLFITKNHPSDDAQNLIPNIVDHIDYLIGGSIINKEREGIRKGYRFEEPEVVEELKERLKRDGKQV